MAKLKMAIRPYIRTKHLAEVATVNFLAAFGVFLAEQGWGHDDILFALGEIDKIMDNEDNAQRLEQAAGIRLEAKG